jgi:hypothetical protein
MKKNISIRVLVGLLLAFGVLAASCDNGVLPEHKFDPKHWEGELDDNPTFNWRVPGSSQQADHRFDAWLSISDTNVYIDWFVNASIIPVPMTNLVTGTLPGDDDIDTYGGEQLIYGGNYGSVSSLVGSTVTVDGTDYVFEAVVLTSKRVLQLKTAP